jgi:hypothetical protein
MRIDPKTVAAPLVALLVLALMGFQTMGALRNSGLTGKRSRSTKRFEDPYAGIDMILARPLLDVPSVGARDPFAFGVAKPVNPIAVVTHKPFVPPPPPRPVLTSIIWDQDPRATIRYDNRDFSVRENSLFADFKVTSITATQVVLDRNGEALVLTLRSKGE